jgi:hypothetical protein
VRAFIDDTTQLAPFEQQQRALTFLKSEAPRYGLSLNFQKFKILMGPCDDSTTARERQYSYMNLCPGIKPHNIILHPSNDPTTSEEVYGVKLLGCPVGSPAFIRRYLCKIATNDLPKEFLRLRCLSRYQSLWCFLHFVVNNKITHLLRVVPPTLTDEFISMFQDIQLDFVSKALGSTLNAEYTFPQLDETTLAQMRLPLTAGGLGLTYFHDVSIAAFLGAFITCLPHIEAAVSSWIDSPTFGIVDSSYHLWSSQATLEPDSPLRPCITTLDFLNVVHTQSLYLKPRLQQFFQSSLNSSRKSLFLTSLRLQSPYHQVRYNSLN